MRGGSACLPRMGIRACSQSFIVLLWAHKQALRLPENKNRILKMRFFMLMRLAYINQPSGVTGLLSSNFTIPNTTRKIYHTPTASKTR